MARKEIDLKELLRLHKTGLSDSALGRHFGVARKVIARRREELSIPSNMAQHTRNSATQKITAYVASRGGAVSWRELTARFGEKNRLIYYGNFRRILFHRQEVAVVYLQGHEQQARKMFDRYVEERKTQREKNSHATVLLRKRAESECDFVTLKELRNAIVLANGRPMKLVDAEETAKYVLGFFGFNERIIDNILTPDDRALFYTLEDMGILKPDNGEVTLYDGRQWRIKYWCLEKSRILGILSRTDVKMRQSTVRTTYQQAFGQTAAGDGLESIIQTASSAASSPPQ